MVWDGLRNSEVCQILYSQVTRCLGDVYVLILKVSINIIILKKKKKIIICKLKNGELKTNLNAYLHLVLFQ